MNHSQQRVAIIGGGFTGLAAAYDLAKQGHAITILERSPDLGGLASGFQIQGTSIEKAYHHLFKTDTDILSLCEELGLKDRLIWHETSMAIYSDGQLSPFTTPVDLLRFKPLSFVNRIRTGLVLLYLQMTNSWKKFTTVPALAWMKKWSGEQATRVIWEPLLKGKFSTYYDRVSMAWLWGRIHTRGNSKERGSVKETLGYVDGGFIVVVEAIKQALLDRGAHIHTGINVQTITTPDAKPHVTYVLGQDVIDQEFDQVVVTTPSSVFASLIKEAATDEYLKLLNSVDYLGAVCLVFSSDQSLSKYYWHSISDPNFPFLVFVQHTRYIDTSHYNGKEVYYLGSYIPNDHPYFALDEAALKQLWFSHLKKIFPDFDERHVADAHLFRFKNAQHIVDLSYEERIPPYQTPIRGVYLSNFSQIFPDDRGTNFAVREGRKVAQLILATK
jgi:protoporphyrinogen oxidase